MSNKIVNSLKFPVTAALLIMMVLTGVKWPVDVVSGAPTYHRGQLEGVNNWGAGTHIVDDEINVTGTLTVQAGASIRMDSSNGVGAITIKSGGALYINGTWNNPVHITENVTGGGYEGIILESGGLAFINHTYIRHANIGISMNGGYNQINHCRINDTGGYGIKFTGNGTPVINNCTINNTGDGSMDSGGIRVSSNGIVNNTSIFKTNGTGVYVSNGTPNIRNTCINNTLGNGIYLAGNSTPTMVGLDINDTGKENLYVVGTSRNITLKNCSVRNSSGVNSVNIAPEANHIVNVTLLNITNFNSKLNGSFNISKGGNLTFGYYARVSINNSLGAPVTGAVVKMAHNVTLDHPRLSNGTSGAYGYAWLTGVHFVYNDTGPWYLGNYTVNVTHPEYAPAQKNIYMDRYRTVSFSLVDTASPNFGSAWNGSLTTGDVATFSVNVTDNVAVNSVRFNFSIDDGKASNWSVSNSNWSGDSWSINVSLPSNATKIRYHFWANDSINNSAGSAVYNKSVTDNDAPTLNSDDSPDSGTTGDTYTFDLNVTDNIGVTSVNITWSHGKLGDDQAMNDDGDGTWSLTITLDHNVSDLTYSAQINDSAGNYFRQPEGNATVTDNDAPQLVSDDSPDSGTTGDGYTFDVNATDNIGVSGVNVTWSHGNLSGNDPLNDDGDGTWSLTVGLSPDIGNLTYSLQINDSAGQYFRQAEQRVNILDNDPPSLDKDDSQAAGTTGDIYTFKANVTDNVGVARVKVVWKHGNLSGNQSLKNIGNHTWNSTISLDQSVKNLTYRFFLNDSAGNSKLLNEKSVAVTDNDLPVFGSQWNSGLTTGDVGFFSANITDNIAVNKVFFNFSFDGGGVHSYEVKNKTGNSRYIRVTISKYAKGMEHRFRAEDHGKNWKKGGATQSSVLDNDLPNGSMLNTNFTTGDRFEVRISADDNIDISSVSFYYKFNHTDGGSDAVYRTLSLSKRSGNVPQSRETWNGTTDIPGDANGISYFFRIYDGTGGVFIIRNGFSTDMAEAKMQPSRNSVVDNDVPVLIGVPDHKERYNTTEEIVIATDIFDNSFRIKEVNITFSGVIKGTFKLTELYPNATYFYKTVAPRDDIGAVYFNITITDRTGNTVTYPEGYHFNFTVIDSLPPVLENIMGNRTIGTDNPFKVVCTLSDNIAATGADLYLKLGSEGVWKSVRMNRTEDGEHATFFSDYPHPIRKTAGIDTSRGIPLYYYIVGYDEEHNSARFGGKEEPYSITFEDDDPPEILDITGSLTVPTEYNYTIHLNATDNYGLNRSVLYIKPRGENDWFKGVTMNADVSADRGNGHFHISYGELRAEFGDKISSLDKKYFNYYIEVTDKTGLKISAGTKNDPFNIEIRDVIAPELLNIFLEPASPITGRELTITIRISDNFDVPEYLNATLVYHFNDRTNETADLGYLETDEGAVFRVTLGKSEVYEDSRTLSYAVEISDTSGNSRTIFFDPIDVKDNIKPEVTEIEIDGITVPPAMPDKPRNVKAGQIISFDVWTFDNIPIYPVETVLEYTDLFTTVNEENYTFNHSQVLEDGKGGIEIADFQQGYIRYRILLTDRAGNNYTTLEYILNVSTNDPDGDGIPDRDEPDRASLLPNGTTKGVSFSMDPTEWADSDDDGIGDNSDDFPRDPAAAIDSDGDGYPDNWLKNMGADNSTTGITHTDDLPYDPSCSLDTDDDGHPDRWNPGKYERDSPSWPDIWLDQYPEDPYRNQTSPVTFLEDKQEDPDMKMIGALAVIVLGVIGIAIYLVIQKVRKEEEEEEGEEEEERKDRKERKKEERKDRKERKKEEKRKRKAAKKERKAKAKGKMKERGKKAGAKGGKEEKEAEKAEVPKPPEEEEEKEIPTEGLEEPIDIDKMLPEDILEKKEVRETPPPPTEDITAEEKGEETAEEREGEGEDAEEEEVDFDIGEEDIMLGDDIGLEEELLGLDFGMDEEMEDMFGAEEEEGESGEEGVEEETAEEAEEETEEGAEEEEEDEGDVDDSLEQALAELEEMDMEIGGGDELDDSDIEIKMD